MYLIWIRDVPRATVLQVQLLDDLTLFHIFLHCQWSLPVVSFDKSLNDWKTILLTMQHLGFPWKWASWKAWASPWNLFWRNGVNYLHVRNRQMFWTVGCCRCLCISSIALSMMICDDLQSISSESCRRLPSLCRCSWNSRCPHCTCQCLMMSHHVLRCFTMSHGISENLCLKIQIVFIYTILRYIEQIVMLLVSCQEPVSCRDA